MNKLRWVPAPNATYRVSTQSAHSLQKRKFLKGFYHIWSWWPSWPCNQDHLNKLSFHFPKINLSSTGPLADIFTFFPYKSKSDQIWPWYKMGQGQPRGIIWTKYDGFQSSMLHTKFQHNHPPGSREKDFEGFLPYIVMAAILVMRPGPFWTNFCSPIPWRLHMKLTSTSPVVSEKMFENVDRRRTRWWQLSPHTISLLVSETKA